MSPHRADDAPAPSSATTILAGPPPAAAPTAVILGAGRTGRGLAAVLCARSGVPVVLVDSDPALVARLRAAGTYPVAVLGSRPAVVERITPSQVHVLSDPAWQPAAVTARVVFTAVFGTNLAALAPYLAAVIQARLANRSGPLDIITCENLTHAARVLRQAVAALLPGGQATLAAARVGFVEAMVLTTSLAPQAGADPLSVRTQNLFRLPCDGDALVAGTPPIAGLEPLPRFENQLMRKIFTYNGINAVISYLGAERGHSQLAAAATDPAILPWAVQAGQEAGAALVAAFGFDVQEQAGWAHSALAKFSDRDIPDPIERNAADPARKLAADDRLVGPALLALTHHGTPSALVRGIVAAAAYREGSAPSLLERHGSLAAVLQATAGLPATHPLVALVVAAGAQAAQGAR